MFENTAFPLIQATPLIQAIDLHQIWRDLDTKPLLNLFLHSVSGEDKRGREGNSNDSIGPKSEHSNMEEVNFVLCKFPSN